MGMKITVFYGSVRSAREGIKAARFIERMLKERDHDIALIDPMEYELPLLDKRLMDYEEGNVPDNLATISRHVRESDAVVVVTAEYNHGVPPALKNLIDHFMQDYFWKPAGIVSYSAGGFGGVRAAIQLRAILPEVGMPTIPSSFAISHVQDAFDDEGTEVGDAGYTSHFRDGKFIKELEWWASAAKREREHGTPYA